MQHYCDLDEQFSDKRSLIGKHVAELKENIRKMGTNKEKHYKYWIYLQFNPELTHSPFFETNRSHWKIDDQIPSRISQVKDRNWPLE